MYKTRYINLILLIFAQSSFSQSPSDWDYLVYSQRWPITACAEWEEKNKSNTCTLPNPEAWTIHGLWPNKIGKEGPFNCPSAIHFDLQALEPIRDELNARWTNIEANTKPDSFWKHEWVKHGTCASSLPQLNSVFNYFNNGLRLNKEYNIMDILMQGGVKPGGNGYNVMDLNNAIVSVTNTKPVIFCEVDKRTKESLLSEIRICFNKSLELIDCIPNGPIHDFESHGDVLTNCNLDKSVKYYADLPMIYADPFNYDIDMYEEYDKRLAAYQLHRHIKFREDLLDFYRYIRFLIWFTF